MKTFRIIATVLLVAWMVMIFCFSAQTAAESSGTSGRFITSVVKFFYSEFDEMSKADQISLIESLQFVVRKGAHITVYAVLGGLAFATVMTYKKLKFSLRLFFNIIICVLYSVSDEIHQSFVSGRSCEIRDVIFDSSGALAAILFLILVTRCKRLYKYVYNGDLMNKKELRALYNDAYKKIEALTAELESTKFKNEALNAKVKELESNVPQIVEVDSPAETVGITVDSKICDNKAFIDPQKELGAKAIGRIIVNAANYCNKLTKMGETRDVKELINLILGRTEVAKAEILNIITAEKEFEEMKILVKSEEAEAEDYFISVLGQI